MPLSFCFNHFPRCFVDIPIDAAEVGRENALQLKTFLSFEEKQRVAHGRTQ